MADWPVPSLTPPHNAAVPGTRPCSFAISNINSLLTLKGLCMCALQRQLTMKLQ